MKSAAGLAAGVAVGSTFPYIARRLLPPNVLLILIDTLRRDRTGYAGYPRGLTPVMDSLAERGVVFDDAVASSSWTKTSMASIQTGLAPYVHRVLAPANSLVRSLPTLPRILRRERWRTFAIQTNPWLGEEGHGFARDYGFFRFLSPNKDKGRRRRVPMRPGLKYAEGCYIVERLAKIVSGIKEHPRPFFGYLHFMDVHEPYLPPPPFDSLFSKPGELVEDDLKLTETSYAGDALDERVLGGNERQRLIDLYDGSIRYADDLVGQVLELLDSRGLLDSTVIVVASDHGEEFWEHGRGGHCKTLYDEVLRVPFLMAGGDLPRGVRVAERIRHVDIAPTILEMLGVEAGCKFDGRSVAACIGGAPPRGDSVNVAYLGDIQRVPQKSITTVAPHAKLISKELGDATRYEFYDLRADPAERHDLAQERPRVVASFAERLDEMEAAAGSRVANQENVKISKDLEQQLKAIGYLN